MLDATNTSHHLTLFLNFQSSYLSRIVLSQLDTPHLACSTCTYENSAEFAVEYQKPQNQREIRKSVVAKKYLLFSVGFRICKK